MANLQPRGAALCLVALAVILGPVRAADGVNPNQTQIDELTHKKELVKAESDLLAAEAELQKNKFPALPAGIGKAGVLTVEEAGRDKFHVTARTADAFEQAAAKLARLLMDQPGRITVLTDADKNALPMYWTQNQNLKRIEDRFLVVLGPPTMATTESAALLGLGALLSQVQQLSQAFRTDKSLSFTDADVPDDFLLELLLQRAPQLLYPGIALDGALTGRDTTDFIKALQALYSRRDALRVWAGSDKAKKETAAALTADLDAFLTALMTPDASTKTPLLVTVLRGELTTTFLTLSNRLALSIRVASKGGASLKTSSWWRSDRLYASGGVTVLYRLTDGALLGTVLKAGVVNAETSFVQIPLD